ncbi:alpha/beta hydrolase [Tenggerimyces flavus]|uniref:Alpha/beta hydrolase fold domain-containing protein n=1 Tax=Tenggerimyces flavus TaxID=1708749 RepID=A0ABV7YL57_9ACTN|nr:alpha/beta hydrolase [Tenggerimyces flavus]MBM7784908.1 acetyl esterase/lipase [Tenggerimyces flavus]
MGRTPKEGDYAMPINSEPLTSITGIRYGRTDLPTLVLDLLGPYPLPDRPLPTVIRVTGPGWTEENRAGYSVSRLGIRFLAAAGFLAGAISVRLSWQAPFPAPIHDVKAAIRWLRAHTDDYPIDPDRIGILGDSAGGHLAALAGLTSDNPDIEGDSGSPGYSSTVQAVVAISANSDFLSLDSCQSTQPPPQPPIRFCRDLGGPVDTLSQLFGGPLAQRQDLMRLASPINHVHRDAPPYLIVHGTRDETVPFEQGEHLHRALEQAGATTTFIPIEGGYHNLRDNPDLPYDSDVWDNIGEQTIEFFDHHLRR